MRPAVRLAALMKAPTIYVWTHDSVALGEDGPTHQPVEQLCGAARHPAARHRPPRRRERDRGGVEADHARRRMGPAGLALSRQNLPVFERGDGEASGDTYASAEGVAKGAYVLAEAPSGHAGRDPDRDRLRVQIAVEARVQLAEEGIDARVVSAPCLEWFDEQSAEYRESVLPSAVKARVSVEAGVDARLAQVHRRRTAAACRHRPLRCVAPTATLLQEFGITTEHVVAAAKESLGR